MTYHRDARLGHLGTIDDGRGSGLDIRTRTLACFVTEFLGQPLMQSIGFGLVDRCLELIIARAHQMRIACLPLSFLGM